MKNRNLLLFVVGLMALASCTPYDIFLRKYRDLENQIDNLINDIIANLTDYDQYISKGSTAPSHSPGYHSYANGPTYYEIQEGWARQYSDLIADNVRWAFLQHPNPKAFYDYLRQPDISRRLTDAAHRIYGDSNPMSNNNRDINLFEIIEILKGSPLTDEERFDLTQSDTGVYPFETNEGWEEE